jgi:hypothetical protein
MSDSDATTATAVRTEPVRWPSGAKDQPPAAEPAPEPAPAAEPSAAGTGEEAAAPAGDGGAAAASPPTGPVPARPSVRPRRSGPLTRMGPWAPVAGALVGVVLGVVAVVLLAGQAVGFRDRLSLVFLVVGLGLLGAAGTLLADEVRMVRWRAREAALRPAAWVDTTAGLLNGLTPARLLLLGSAFVLFLSAYVPSR